MMRLRGSFNRPLQTPSRLKNLFAGPGGVRATWRILLFLALVAVQVVLISLLVQLIWVRALHHAPKLPSTLGPSFFVVNELALLLPAASATWAMAWLEDRPLLSYGLTGPRRGRLLLAGMALGLVAISALMLLLALTGFGIASAGTLSLAGGVRYGLEWAMVCLLIGLTEEFFFRGYMLQTLERAAGVWPAALLTSLAFGAAHGHNPGETYLGLVQVMFIGLVFCLAIHLTKSLWFTIGLHGAWDYGENFVYGTHDSGTSCYGTLMTFAPHGNVYLSGGATGPEGSLLCFAIMALTGAVIWGLLRPAGGVASK